MSVSVRRVPLWAQSVFAGTCMSHGVDLRYGLYLINGCTRTTNKSDIHVTCTQQTHDNLECVKIVLQKILHIYCMCSWPTYRMLMMAVFTKRSNLIIDPEGHTSYNKHMTSYNECNSSVSCEIYSWNVLHTLLCSGIHWQVFEQEYCLFCFETTSLWHVAHIDHIFTQHPPWS